MQKKEGINLPNKAYSKIMSGKSDSNIKFLDLVYALEKNGFVHRVRGDHHIFTKQGVVEIINIQPNGNQAKPYQVGQVRNIFIKYGI